MAKKTVVENADPFVEAVGKAVDLLQKSHGPLFAALLAHLPDRPVDDWVLLVGSKALEQRRLEGIRAIVKAIRKAVSSEHATRIRRVDVLRSDDPVYLRLCRAFAVDLGSMVVVQSSNVFGLDIEHAILFAMTPVNGQQEQHPANDQPSRKRKQM